MPETVSNPDRAPKPTAPKPWRLYAALVVFAVLPLALFIYVADWYLRRNFIRGLPPQAQRAAEIVGKLLDDKLTDVKSSLEAIAANPATFDAWDRGNSRILLSQLQEASRLRRDAAFFAIYDSSGSRQMIYPNAAGLDANVASAEWFQAALQSSSPYISSVVPMPGASHEQAVMVVVPLHGHGHSGMLAGAYTLDTLKGWFNGVSPGISKWTTVVDQKGAVTIGPDADVAIAQHSRVDAEDIKKVLARQGGTELARRGSRQLLVTRYPLSWGWGLLVQIPGSEIDKTIWQFERPIAWLGLGFVVLAVTVGGVGAAVYRRLRDSEEHVQQIVTTATDAFIAIDEIGAITEWNPQAEVLFGWSRTEVLGDLLHALIIPERYREAYRRGLKHFLASSEGPVLNQRLELTARHRDGREFPVELSISHMRRGRKNFFNAFMHDISERKRAQEEIAALNAELIAQVSQLEARNKELEAFGYSVSHDVRAPLRHIAGFSKMLAQECGPQITLAGREYLAQIQGSALRMQQLVNDLLRFSRLGEQGLRKERTSLEEVILEVVSVLERDLDGRQVAFDIAPLPSMECDRGLVRQVFWNLLSNAVKFTGTREHAVISVGYNRQGEEDVFFVRDNGVGFDMKYADKLFGVFQRLHRQEEFEGTGVGLATVQRIVLKHKGRIWAQAEPDRGAAFFFTLRAAERRVSVA